VTVGAVEVERDTKEAETGGQEKRGSKQVGTEKGGGPKAYKTSSTTADREKEGWGGKEKVGGRALQNFSGVRSFRSLGLTGGCRGSAGVVCGLGCRHGCRGTVLLGEITSKSKVEIEYPAILEVRK